MVVGHFEEEAAAEEVWVPLSTAYYRNWTRCLAPGVEKYKTPRNKRYYLCLLA